MPLDGIERRRFLMAALLFGGSAATLRSSRIWAQTGRAGTSLVGFARRLYPHDGLDDAVYAGILEAALGASAADSGFSASLDAAERALNARRGADFVELDASEQIAVMQEVEETDFFAAIRTEVRTRLYNHPAFWELIGYEGSSWERGGYLNRGAGEIDWLPETD